VNPNTPQTRQYRMYREGERQLEGEEGRGGRLNWRSQILAGFKFEPALLEMNRFLVCTLKAKQLSCCLLLQPFSYQAKTNL